MYSPRFARFICSLIPLFVANLAAAQQSGSFPWEGEITAANVYVRSGAGSNWYPTMKVNTGDHVLVLGEKFGWYQIAPPAGSFSYVDIASIDRKPGAKIVLSKGATVEIDGEADGFYRIKPPAGAALYLSKQYAKPIEPNLSTGLVERHISAQPATTTDPAAPPVETKIPEQQDPSFASGRTPADTDPSATTPIATSQTDSTQLASATPDVAPSQQNEMPIETESVDKSGQPAAGTSKKESTKDATSPTDKPPIPAQPQVDPAGRQRATLAVLESELVAMFRKPIGEQEYESLRQRYSEISKQKDDYVSAEVAKIRLRQLKDRGELRDARTKLVSDSRDIETYRANMDQERIKIANRRMEKTLLRYDLEGELRRSLAFAPENHRYRLVDRTTQATLAYVDIAPSVAPDVDQLVGRFVGIHTAGQRFSPSARVPIAVAAEVVDLSLRLQPIDDLPPTDSNQGQRSTAPDESVAPHESATPPADTNAPPSN